MMQSLVSASNDTPSYHDLVIETKLIEPTSISNLPFGYELSCSRTSGWTLSLFGRVVAYEYPDEQCSGLRVTINNFVVVDSLTKQRDQKK